MTENGVLGNENMAAELKIHIQELEGKVEKISQRAKKIKSRAPGWLSP